MTEAMQMTVSNEMAKRMDDSTSITARPLGELRSDSGLEATVVMGVLKKGAKKGV
jgi:hypothetical protein